jgi:hypothetical protein
MSGLRPADRDSVRLTASDWSTGWLQWTATAGIDVWAPESPRLQVGGSVGLVTLDDRLDAAFEASGWLGRGAFTTIDAGIRARSSNAKRGVVLVGTANLQFATHRAPLDLWWAGDTGHVRSTLLRAHPLLDGGELRVDRLGRILGQFSLEAQRWWSVVGPISAAAAVFGDVARTAQLYDSQRARRDVDVGIGAHLAVSGIRGQFSANVAKGLADGATAFSVTYTP